MCDSYKHTVKWSLIERANVNIKKKHNTYTD